jgi:PAS domain S-box-containing protein
VHEHVALGDDGTWVMGEHNTARWREGFAVRVPVQVVVEADDLAFRDALAALHVGTELASASGSARRRRPMEIREQGERPVFGDGQFVNTRCFTLDVTGQREAEAALREAALRLNAVLDNASVSVFLMDERQQCVYMNAAAEKLTGYTLKETLGRPLHDVVDHTRPDGSHYPLEECPIDRAFPENNQESGEEIFVHKDGSFYPVAFTASPIRDENAKVIGTIIEVRDIAEQKAAERRKELLVNELNHRVKNTLATVQSIAAQTFRASGADTLSRQLFDSRLMALSKTHDLLTRQNWEGADLADIVPQAVAPLSGHAAGRFTIEGPSVVLSPNMALSISMTLHELATNAVKYGALSNDEGHVAITWTVSSHPDAPRLRMRWMEWGGQTVAPPTRQGFGSRMIERGLAQDLGGTVELTFAPTGAACTIEAPLPAPPESAPDMRGPSW